MTFDPSGSRSSRKPSPWCMSSGGVRSSTSSTKPGLLTLNLPLTRRIEGDFDGAETPGVGRVCKSLPPAGERVGRADVPVEGRGLGEPDGVGEVGPVGTGRVGADQLQLAIPQ